MKTNYNDKMLIYQSADGQIKIDVRFENETVWLSLDQMSTLFGRDKSTVSRHIKNIFEEGELQAPSVVANSRRYRINCFGRLVARQLPNLCIAVPMYSLRT